MSLSSEMKDRICVSSLQNGSEKAFDFLYKKYYYFVYAISLSITHSCEDAEEVTDDTFAKIWSIQGQIDPGYNFRNFISLVAKNLSIDRTRSRPKIVSGEVESDQEVAAEPVNLAAGQDAKDLEEALSRILSETELFVFLGHLRRDLSFKAIGKVLGISTSAASSLYFRARMRLQQDPEIIALASK